MEKIQGYAIVLKQIDGKGLPSFSFKILVLYNYKKFLGIFHCERSSQALRAVADPHRGGEGRGGG